MALAFAGSCALVLSIAWLDVEAHARAEHELASAPTPVLSDLPPGFEPLSLPIESPWCDDADIAVTAEGRRIRVGRFRRAVWSAIVLDRRVSARVLAATLRSARDVPELHFVGRPRDPRGLERRFVAGPAGFMFRSIARLPRCIAVTPNSPAFAPHHRVLATPEPAVVLPRQGATRRAFRLDPTVCRTAPPSRYGDWSVLVELGPMTDARALVDTLAMIDLCGFHSILQLPNEG